ncbi:MAG TPA: hypothetical protein VN277_03335 [Acidiferrobacterales bacterium]|nr:hypothetical protein [Acidiferrobacterales bacterium]
MADEVNRPLAPPDGCEIDDAMISSPQSPARLSNLRMLIRMGSENAAKVKGTLREMRRALTGPIPS